MKQWFYVYRQWLQRELQLRFRSSALGQSWLVLQPLAQILLFTLVFYQFFQVRWPSGDGSVGAAGDLIAQRSLRASIEVVARWDLDNAGVE